MTAHGPSPSFSWNAADYSRSSPAQKQWAEELIAKLGLFGTEHVLDIGCGDGKVTAGIAGKLPEGHVVGIDSSHDMILFARTHFPATTYPNLFFMEMNTEALAFRGVFDVIFSNAALHWVHDHTPVLAGVSQSLRPGGRLVIQMGGKGNAAQVFEAVEVLLQKPPWKELFTGFSFTFGFFGTEEYRVWLQEAGLVPLRVELIKKDMVHRTRQDFSGWVRTTWLPYLCQVPDNLHNSFIDALYDQYTKIYPADAHGAIHIGMVRLEVDAIKESSASPALRNL